VNKEAMGGVLVCPIDLRLYISSRKAVNVSINREIYPNNTVKLQLCANLNNYLLLFN